MKDTITIVTIATPLGSVSAASSPRGLGYLGFGEQAPMLAATWARRWLPEAHLVYNQPAWAELATQLAAYFAGELREWTLPLDLRGTPFQLRAWLALRQIPVPVDLEAPLLVTTALPTAATVFVVAQRYGVLERVAAAVVFVSHLAGILTLTVILVLLQG
jgi:hypothetical protein